MDLMLAVASSPGTPVRVVATFFAAGSGLGSLTLADLFRLRAATGRPPERQGDHSSVGRRRAEPSGDL